MRSFKVVQWTKGHKWLVEVTGADGSYTPITTISQNGDGSEPTYNNQRLKAAKLLETGGIEALRNPHVFIGESCGCGTCFTCVAHELIQLIKG